MDCITPSTNGSKRTYCRDEGGVESVLGEAEEHAGLPDARVADEEQLEEVVVRLGHGEGGKGIGMGGLGQARLGRSQGEEESAPGIKGAVSVHGGGGRPGGRGGSCVSAARQSWLIEPLLARSLWI